MTSARSLLRWQFQVAHELLDAAVGALDAEAGRRRPAGAPGLAAAGYAHALLCEDLSVNGVLGAGEPLALSTWAGRTGLSELPPLVGSLLWFYLKVAMAGVSLLWIFRLVETGCYVLIIVRACFFGIRNFFGNPDSSFCVRP